MRAVVLKAENQGWLSAGPSGSHAIEATWPALRLSRQAPPAVVGSHGALNFVPCPGFAPAHDNETIGLGAVVMRNACPVLRKPRRLLTTILASLALHVSVALAAIGLLPSADPPMAERGGDSVLDVVTIGAEEAAVLFEGARPEPASLVMQPDPEPDPVRPPVATNPPPPDDRRRAPEPPVIEPPPPVADIPQLDFSRQPDFSRDEVSTLPSAVPAIPRPPVEQPPVELPRVEAKPLEVARIATRPVAQRAKKPRPPDPARKNAKARGAKGEGQAEANRAAQSRGGTGGQSNVAGHSVITSYRSRLVAHLTRYKSYPEQAQERGLMGRNAVTLTITRAGHVVSAALSSASGHSLLDSATMAAVRHAQPFPAIPDGGPASITVTIGLNYALR